MEKETNINKFMDKLEQRNSEAIKKKFELINKIKKTLEGEISSSQPIIDGDEEVTDGTDDIIIGRYEYAEQLLEQIKQWENE
jgi:hypothetical protein